MRKQIQTPTEAKPLALPPPHWQECKDDGGFSADYVIWWIAEHCEVRPIPAKPKESNK